MLRALLFKKGNKTMRCKIIEIGPADAFVGDIDRFRGAKGFFKRETMCGCGGRGCARTFDRIHLQKWLKGRFLFDDPSPSSFRALTFDQIKVEPIPAI